MDIQRLVRFERSGRAVVLLDLNEDSATPGMYRKRDSFKFTPGPRRTSQAMTDVEFRGVRVLPAAHDNGQVATTFAIQDDDPAVAAQRVETFLDLLDTIRVNSREVYVEWRAENLAHSTFYRIQGPAQADLNYLPRPWAGGPNMVEVTATWPVEPAAYGHPMSLDERFDEVQDGDRLSEWTLDATGTGLTVGATGLTASGGKTRMRLTERGYKTANLTVSAKFKTPSSFSGSFEVEVGKAVDANNYIVARATETGSTHALEIRTVIAGGTSTVQATSTPGAFTTATTYWIRLIFDSNTYRAELWTSDPNLAEVSTTPASTIGPTALGGGLTALQAGGLPFVSWQPTSSSALLQWVSANPYSFRGASIPTTFTLASVPGSAPATVDVDFTTPNNQIVRSAIYSWWPKPSSGTAMFGMFLNGNDDTGSRAGSLTSVSDSDSPNGTALRLDTGPNTIGTVRWLWDAGAVEFGDERDDTVEVEGYLIARVQNTINGACFMTFSAGPWGGSQLGITYTGLYGSAGRAAFIPASSGSTFRTYALGSITVPRKLMLKGRGFWRIDVNSSTSSTGNFDIMALIAVPVRSRAASPTNKSSTDGTYPVFAQASTDHRTKRIDSYLQGQVLMPNGTDWAWDAGLGGSHIQVGPGDTSFLAHMSQAIIDDTTNPTATVAKIGTSGVNFRVQPRYRMWRPD